MAGGVERVGPDVSVRVRLGGGGGSRIGRPGSFCRVRPARGDTTGPIEGGDPLSTRVGLGGSARWARSVLGGDIVSYLAKSFGHGRAHAHRISCCPAGAVRRSALLGRQKVPPYANVISSEIPMCLLLRRITSSSVLSVSTWSVSQFGEQLWLTNCMEPMGRGGSGGGVPSATRLYPSSVGPIEIRWQQDARATFSRRPV